MRFPLCNSLTFAVYYEGIHLFQCTFVYDGVHFGVAMARKNPEVERTREDIRTAARALFLEKGVYAASLQDIAKEAGVSKGTLYYHFPAKDALVMDIAEEYFAAVTELMFNWVDWLDASCSATEALEPLFSALTSNADMLRLRFALSTEALRTEGLLRARMAKKRQEWSTLMEVGALKVAGPGAQRLRALCADTFALIDGYAMDALVCNKEIDTAQWLENILGEQE